LPVVNEKNNTFLKTGASAGSVQHCFCLLATKYGNQCEKVGMLTLFYVTYGSVERAEWLTLFIQVY